MKTKNPLYSELRGSIGIPQHGEYYTCKTMKDGTIRMIRKPIPSNPRTVDQEGWRNKFILSSINWNALSPEQKKQWNEDAIPHRITGYDLFMKDSLGTTGKFYFADKDVLVMQNYPVTNFNGEHELRWGDDATSREHTLIHFDFSEIPAESVILEAILSFVYENEAGWEGDGRIVDIYRHLGSWVEDEVTWNTKPSYAAVRTAYTPMPSQMQRFEFDVVEDVKKMVPGTWTNHGWSLLYHEDGPGGQASHPGMRSREDIILRAWLKINWKKPI